MQFHTHYVNVTATYFVLFMFFVPYFEFEWGSVDQSYLYQTKFDRSKIYRSFQFSGAISDVIVVNGPFKQYVLIFQTILDPPFPMCQSLTFFSTPHNYVFKSNTPPFCNELSDCYLSRVTLLDTSPHCDILCLISNPPSPLFYTYF